MHADGTLTTISKKWFSGADLTVVSGGEAAAPAAEATGEAAATDPDGAYGGEFKSIEAVDDLTVKFSLCHPDVAFPSKAAFSAFQIQSSEYLEKTGGKGDLIEKPIGTGPYELQEWKKRRQHHLQTF